ncbi:DUF5518 domain-containing protein [Halovivax cerinus]|uniref:DUF5518 domain-containing protein n=1 Tax=Halovivax cerinus TaxID=1487865 RepID=A0ABD5NQ23_9EURY|nr:DUF5518 domain-containing protein [Halovivax cerinus]
MVSDSHAPAGAPAHEYDFGTGVNALFGGVVGIFLSFVPGSPLLGGAVAGYLELGESSDALTVGAIAGLVMLVPIALFGLFVTVILLGFAPGESVLVFGGFLLVALTITAVYTVGLSIVGALLGQYVAQEM